MQLPWGIVMGNALSLRFTAKKGGTIFGCGKSEKEEIGNLTGLLI
jgi:hypothetical protein